MSRTRQRWSKRDLSFIIRNLVPDHSEPEHAVSLIQEDRELLEAMLQDERLFQRMMADDEVFISISPQLFFHVLLLQARRDLEQELYTIERRHQQKVVLFDANRVAELIADPAMLDYLAAMLASYTRVNSVTIPIRVRPGVWRRFRVNDLDVDSLMRYAQILDEQVRFATYQRIGDACLFLTSIFPEYIGAHSSYPYSGQPRPRLKGSLVHSLDDYEAFGRTFYHLAARTGRPDRLGWTGYWRPCRSSSSWLRNRLRSWQNVIFPCARTACSSSSS